MATVPRVRINMLGFTCHAQIPKAGQRQACNGVVQLDEIEVIDRQPCARQQLSHGRNRANAHDTRFDILPTRCQPLVQIASIRRDQEGRLRHAFNIPWEGQAIFACRDATCSDRDRCHSRFTMSIDGDSNNLNVQPSKQTRYPRHVPAGSASLIGATRHDLVLHRSVNRTVALNNSSKRVRCPVVSADLRKREAIPACGGSNRVADGALALRPRVIDLEKCKPSPRSQAKPRLRPNP